MSSSTYLKVKALMIIAMLAVSEGRRIQDISGLNSALESHTSSESRRTSGREMSSKLESVPAAPQDMPMDVLMNDPVFKEQLVAMAGHMDEFAVSMKEVMTKEPELLRRATNMANEMFKLSTDSSSSPEVGSTLPKDMEAMIADHHFQQHSQQLADIMQQKLKLNKELQEELDAAAAPLSSEQTPEMVAEKVTEVITEPEFQQNAGRVSKALESLMQDPELLEQAESLAAYLESARDSEDLDTAAKVTEQVDAMIANTKFKAKAAAVVYKMLEAETKDGPEPVADDELMKELTALAENPTQELMEAMEAMGSTPEVMEVLKKAMGNQGGEDLEKTMEKALESVEATQASLLQETSRQEDASKPPVGKPLMAALMMLVGQGGAFQAPGLVGPKRVATASQNNNQQAFGGLAPLVNTMGTRPYLGAQMSALDSKGEEWEQEESELPAHGLFEQSKPDSAALTSARGIRSMLPSLKAALQRRGADTKMEVKDADGNVKKGFPVDVPLLLCFALWYLGNYYYNITNKQALVGAGGAAGFPMTIAALQLGVGSMYALFLWLAPDARQKPNISFKDYVATLPVGLMSAGAHAASVFALGAGSVSFAQIVKASEPAFAAVIGTLIYGVKISSAKWLSLIPVIGGVCLASLGELNFAMGALVSATIANVMAAIKANENQKLMNTEGLKDRMGSVGNQFAITTINAFLFTLPLMFITEGARLGEFFTLMKTSPQVLNSVVTSGMWFYGYNELATLTIKKTGAVTASVANTAKRVIVIVVVALVMKESLTPLKLIGSGIGIGGVFLYSIIDKLVEARRQKKVASP